MKEYKTKLISMFTLHTNEELAKPLASYLRNQFPMLGIQKPQRSEIQKTFFKENKLSELKEIPDFIKDLWSLPEREFHYCALDLLRKIEKKSPSDFIDLYEYLIINKSWWDTVDLIAGKLVSSHFLRYPDLRNKYVRKWVDSGNIWLQRTALLFQLHYKKKTDLPLLFSIIERLKDSPEFFIRKAIGWILREYSKTDSQLVQDYLKKTKLSSLSEREALKIIKKTEG